MSIDDGLMLWAPCIHPVDNFWTPTVTAISNMSLQAGKINTLTPQPNDGAWATLGNIYKGSGGFRNSWRRYIEWDGALATRHFSTILGERLHFEKPAMAFAAAFSIDAWHATNPNTHLFSKGTDGVDYSFAAIKANGGVGFSWASNTANLPAGTVTLGKWFFVMGSGDASGHWISIMLVDGGTWINATGAGGTPTYSTEDAFHLGAGFGGNPIPVVTATLRGKAQNVMVWDQKKDQTEMEAGILDFIEPAAPSAGGGSGRIRSRIMMPVASRGVIG